MSRMSTLLERVLQPESGGLSPEYARYVLSLGFTEDERERYVDLSERVQDGSLTPAEQKELDEFLFANGILALLQSKARRSLNQSSSAA